MKRPKCKERYWVRLSGVDHKESKRAIALCRLNEHIYLKCMRCNKENCTLDLFSKVDKSEWIQEKVQRPI